MRKKLSSQSSKQDKLKALDEQIAERSKYLKNQEQVINETVESGNTRLMELNHDIALAQQELRDLKVDIRNARRDKSQLTDDLAGIRNDIMNATGGVALNYA